MLILGIFCISQYNMVKARFLNGVFTGGCATLRKEVVAMKKYIIKKLFFTIVFLIVFTINVK